MTVLSGGDLVLPDRVIEGGRLVIEGGRIATIEPPARSRSTAAANGTAGEPGGRVIDVSGSFVVPGFIDVHVHGVAGVDVQDTGDAIGAVASLLPRYGVTAFCPTSIACTPAALRQFLAAVWHHRRNGAGGVVTAVSAAGSSAATGAVTGAARVLPAHLESNFIHPDYRGAQPRACLRVPPGGLGSVSGAELLARHVEASTDGFDGLEILQVIAGRVSDVGIVTVAPELPGGLDLVQWLRANGHYASIGHTAADVDLAMAAFDGGITQATHLFNRMPPLGHRAPGAAGAVLARPDVVAELICDAYHVHPAMARVAIGAKGPHGLMAITDGTAGSGRPAGTRVRLGGQAVTVSEHAAVLDDGTLAGSTLTMDRAFRNIVTRFGASVVDAALMCATTPARALGLADVGVLAEGAAADVVVLDRDFRVQRTFLGGREVFSAG